MARLPSVLACLALSAVTLSTENPAGPLSLGAHASHPVISAAAERAGATAQWASVALATAAHWPTTTADGFELRASGAKARFTPAGVQVGDWGYAFVDSVAQGLAAPRREGAKVAYTRSHGVTEWYQWTDRGFEQGFTVERAPTADLVVQGVVTGAEAKRTEHGWQFGSWQYGEVHAYDARGEALPTHVEWNGQTRVLGLRIAQADLAHAAWPVTIDPLISTANWVVDPSNAASTFFGVSIAAAGDVNGDGFDDVVVGANGFGGSGIAGEGRAYAFMGSAVGLSTSPGWVVDPTDQVGANFGHSVAGVGDVNADGYDDVVVGAEAWDSAGFANEGRAYLFLGGVMGLSTSASWSADPSDQVDANFGFSVAAAGDVNGDGFADVIIGAVRFGTGPVAGEGRAYVYLGQAAGAGLAASAAWLVDPTNQLNANFGGSVASAGDVNGDGYADVVVSAPVYDGAATDEGRVYGYQGSAMGLSTTASWVVDPTDQAGARFGYAVTGAGDVNGDGYSDVLVGADSFDTSIANEGRAYVYLGSGAGLLNSPAWFVDPTDQTDSYFGTSVSAAGDVNGDGFSDIVVGSHLYSNETSFEGRAYLFLGGTPATGVGTTPAWFSDPSDQFASSFAAFTASAGDTNGDGFADVVVGASNWDSAFTDEGRAYGYTGYASGLATTPNNTATPTAQTDAFFGAAGAGAQDLNRDGYADVVVGAPGWGGTPFTAEGRVYVFLGTPTGFMSGPTFDPTDQANARFASSVAGVGDVDGDGYSDFVVGAPQWSGAAAGEGRAYLFTGNATGGKASPAWVIDPTDTANANFGASVAGAGDVNGDGYADVVVGAPGVSTAYLYLGSPGGLGLAPAWSFTVANSEFGASVAGVGDVNKDGLSDVVIGAPAFTGTGVEGRAYLFTGTASGLSATPAWSADPTEQAGARFGQVVAGAGDFNRDGLGDVLISAPSWDSVGFTDEGRVFLYTGSQATGLSAAPTFVLDPADQGGAAFGSAAATAGDVNGDGFADIVIGAAGYGAVPAAEGRAYVYTGNATATPTLAWSLDPTNQAGANFGVAAGGVGDINGDGFGDVAIGASGFDATAANEGVGFFYFGGDSNQLGLDRRFGQFLADGTTRLAPGTGAFSGTTVLQGRVTAEHWAGARMRLALEVKPVGTPFNGQGTLVTSQAVGGQLASLTTSWPNGAYHWRARVVYPAGLGEGRWVSGGLGNSEAEVDFRVVSALALGAPCSTYAQCISGACVDGVCCNTTCAGACDACSVAAGAPLDGTCALLGGTTVCRPSAGACDLAETCTGSSAACPTDTFADPSVVCRGDAGVCDLAETCTGASAACPADGFLSAAVVCRGDAGVCDVAETCTGSSAACPADAVVPAATTCRAAAGACDVAETCTGVSKLCPPDSLRLMGSVCRGDAGVCDVAETCSGVSAACPADGFLGPVVVCRPSGGICDLAEQCSGASAACPADTFVSASTTCRAAAGVCDVAENCTGTTATCPTDAVKGGVVCRAAAGPCDVAEACSGGVNCPADVFVASTTTCRPADGGCDVAENCSGASAACPADVFQGSGVTCRASAGPCDVPETCTGLGGACPTDGFAPTTVVCRGDAGVCDQAETCSGTGAACPADAFLGTSTVCRGSVGNCDTAERCTGVAASCPTDVSSCGPGQYCAGAMCAPQLSQGSACATDSSCLSGNCVDGVCCNSACAGACDACNVAGSVGTCTFVSASTVCRPSAGACDVPESCTGASAACPTDAFASSTQSCRAATGPCDVAETCTGLAADCPADAVAGGNAVCRSAAGVCDVSEQCSGVSPACPADALAPSSATCRDVTGPCDLAETCTGLAVDCPADGFVAASTVCRAATDGCDVAEVCTGTAPDCPPNGYASLGTVCRAATGLCDSAETCAGNGAPCPADAIQLKGTVCRASAGACDAPDTCDGVTTACADVLLEAGVSCRVAAGPCDLAECTGASVDCPTGFAPPTKSCRPAAGPCDVEERCSGASAACPDDAVVPSGGAGNPSCAPFVCSADGVACPTGCVPGSACADGEVCAADGLCHGTAVKLSVGCGCASGPGAGWSWWLLAAAVVAVARRRRPRPG